MMNASFPDLAGEHRTKPVPPEPYRLVANVYTTLKQDIFYLPKRQWIADIHHDREANHLGRAIEISKWIAHHPRLRNLTTKLKPICSDNALSSDRQNDSVGLRELRSSL